MEGGIEQATDLPRLPYSSFIRIGAVVVIRGLRYLVDTLLRMLCLYPYAHTCMLAPICIHVYICIHMCVCVCLHLYMRACMFDSKCTCMYYCIMISMQGSQSVGFLL